MLMLVVVVKNGRGLGHETLKSGANQKGINKLN